MMDVLKLLWIAKQMVDGGMMTFTPTVQVYASCVLGILQQKLFEVYTSCAETVLFVVESMSESMVEPLGEPMVTSDWSL